MLIRTFSFNIHSTVQPERKLHHDDRFRPGQQGKLGWAAQLELMPVRGQRSWFLCFNLNLHRTHAIET